MATSVWAKQGGMWGSPWKALLLCSSPGNQEENHIFLQLPQWDKKLPYIRLEISSKRRTTQIQAAKLTDVHCNLLMVCLADSIKYLALCTCYYFTQNFKSIFVRKPACSLCMYVCGLSWSGFTFTSFKKKKKQP